MGRKKTDAEDDDPNAFSVFFRSPSTFSGESQKRNLMSLSLPAGGSPDNLSTEKVESNNKNDQENLKSLRSSLGLQPRKIRTSSTQHNMLKDNVLHPPKEVMIDPNAIPPSPMRYPDMSETQRMPLSNLLNSPSQSPMRLGDPVGDIAMKTQILDAQRLVRIILGKSTDDQPLETENILQAIRVFALMKAELVQLRKQQETNDGDPPAILPLESPATTCTRSTFFAATPPKVSHEKLDIHRKAIIASAKKITTLQQQLSVAESSIQKIQIEKQDSNDLLTKVLRENEELKEKLKAQQEGMNEYRKQIKIEFQKKDQTISELKCDDAKIQVNINRANESLSTYLNIKGPLREESTTHDKRQELCDGFESELQSTLVSLKNVLDLLPKRNDDKDSTPSNERLEVLLRELSFSP